MFDAKLIFNAELKLSVARPGGASFAFGQLHIAGPPCVDFSGMGRRRGKNGPTASVLLTWAAGVSLGKPGVVIFENDVSFPLDLFASQHGAVV